MVSKTAAHRASSPGADISQLFLNFRRANPHRDGSPDQIEIHENDKHLVSPMIRIAPALRRRRIEEISHQPVRVTMLCELLFEHASSLEFGQTLQFIAGQPPKKIDYEMSVCRACVPKQSTEKRRARGYSGQN